MKRLAVSLAVLALCATSTGAADLGGKPKWPGPYQRQAPPPSFVEDDPKLGEFKVHNWYVGAFGGYSWGEECTQIEVKGVVGFPCGSDNTITAGLYGGYLWRPNSVFGAGVEVDYGLRDLGTFDLGDYLASARGRAGLYLTTQIFLYATGGYGRRADRGGPVWGGGIEYALSKRASARFEVLRFEHDGVFTATGGDDNNTVARAGLSVMLN